MRCRPRLFTLVNPEKDQDVFAVGIDMGDEAITYRPRNQFGVLESAKAALSPAFGECAGSDSGP